MKILSKVEVEATYDKAVAYFRKYETKNGLLRLDLSYTPKAK
jgi:hypothetical protein